MLRNLELPIRITLLTAAVALFVYAAASGTVRYSQNEALRTSVEDLIDSCRMDCSAVCQDREPE